MGAEAGSERAGRIVVLNGPSSSGKTSIARALQESLPEPYLRWGLDTFFAAVPHRWAGGPRGEHRGAGFRYLGDRGEGPDRKVAGIGHGPVGMQVLRGMHRAFAAVAAAGNNEIIDGVYVDPEAVADLAHVLQPFDAVLVGVRCDPEILERRERARGGPIGLARSQVESAHQGWRYDLAYDTSSRDPSSIAKEIMEWLADNRGTALAAMSSTLLGTRST